MGGSDKVLAKENRARGGKLVIPNFLEQKDFFMVSFSSFINQEFTLFMLLDGL